MNHDLKGLRRIHNVVKWKFDNISLASSLCSSSATHHLTFTHNIPCSFQRLTLLPFHFLSSPTVSSYSFMFHHRRTFSVKGEFAGDEEDSLLGYEWMTESVAPSPPRLTIHSQTTLSSHPPTHSVPGSSLQVLVGIGGKEGGEKIGEDYGEECFGGGDSFVLFMMQKRKYCGTLSSAERRKKQQQSAILRRLCRRRLLQLRRRNQ